jgi:DNA-binding LytR/AlgR family response regulator
LVDDEPAALERLSALIGQIDDVEVVGQARDGREAAEAVGALCPDLVLLDIQMPERSGLAVAADLPQETRPEIIFVTAFEMYAPDAFEVEAADYLLKPVRFDRLRQAIERAKRRATIRHAARRAIDVETAQTSVEEEDGFWVQTRRGHLRVPVAEIDWIEAAKDYVLLHTATRSHMHRTTMNALEERLNPADLIRVHRSAFVRPALVSEVAHLGKGLISLILRDGVSVQVGPSYANAVLERLRLG